MKDVKWTGKWQTWAAKARSLDRKFVESWVDLVEWLRDGEKKGVAVDLGLSMAQVIRHLRVSIHPDEYEATKRFLDAFDRKSAVRLGFRVVSIICRIPVNDPRKKQIFDKLIHFAETTGRRPSRTVARAMLRQIAPEFVKTASGKDEVEAKLRQRVKELEKENSGLKRENAQLRKENLELKAKLTKK